MPLIRGSMMWRYRVARNHARGERLARLADAMYAVHRLRPDCLVPPRVEQEHVLRRRVWAPVPWMIEPRFNLKDHCSTFGSVPDKGRRAGGANRADRHF